MSGMTKDPRIPPSAPRSVVVLVPPGSQLIGALGFFEALDAANRVLAWAGKPALYRLTLAGVAASTAAVSGPVLRTTPSDTLESPHTLVVAGAFTSPDEPVHPGVLAEAGRLAADSRRVVGVCVGTFVLAELGLLAGRRCTTHWLGLPQLRARFPDARVEDDAIFTEDGPVLTSAGATAAIDLALHLIRQDGGARLAQTVARTLVVFAQRPGGQSQFGATLQLRPGLDERLRRLVAQVVAEPAGDHRVERLAARVGMSPRHFARVFREQTGETPAAFVAKVRVEAAQRQLGRGDDGLAAVASAVGFGSEETLRRSFLRVVGVTPSAWRARFGSG